MVRRPRRLVAHGDTKRLRRSDGRARRRSNPDPARWGVAVPFMSRVSVMMPLLSRVSMALPLLSRESMAMPLMSCMSMAVPFLPRVSVMMPLVSHSCERGLQSVLMCSWAPVRGVTRGYDPCSCVRGLLFSHF